MANRWNVEQWIEYQRKRQILETFFQCLTNNFSDGNNNGNYGPQQQQWQNQGSNNNGWNGPNPNNVGRNMDNNFWQDQCNFGNSQGHNFSQIPATNFEQNQGQHFSGPNNRQNQGNNFGQNRVNNLGQQNQRNFSGTKNMHNNQKPRSKQNFNKSAKKQNRITSNSNANQSALIAEMYDTKKNLELLKMAPPRIPKPPQLPAKNFVEQQKQDMLWKEYRTIAKPIKNKEYANAKRSVQRLGKLDYSTLDEKQRFRLDGAREAMARIRNEGIQKHLEWERRQQESKNAVGKKKAKRVGNNTTNAQ